MGRLSKLLICLCFTGLFVWLLLIAISNLGLFQPNWPFELFASFMRQAFLVSLMGFIVLFVNRRKKPAVVLVLLSIFAFWPLVNSKKYTPLDRTVCDIEKCYSALFANLRREPEAFKSIRQFSRLHSVDIIALSEVPPQMTLGKLGDLLGDYPHRLLIDTAPDGRKLGSFMVIASKLSMGSQSVFVEDYPVDPRSVAIVELEGQDRHFEFVLTHPRMPLSHAGMRRRDEIFSILKQHISGTERFVIAGDFNVTPWTPAFEGLPGRRAGDPRLVSTWKDGWRLFGIPIDHIFIGESISLAKTVVLPSTGSDHRPILIHFIVKSD